MHRGIVGASNLNVELQKTLNPREDGITRGSRKFRINDKVMQIKNNYDKEVFNGDIGRILNIDTAGQEVTIVFDGRHVVYDYIDLDEIVLAYAVSVHKSQGSEYPVIVIPILTQHYMLLQRNLLYTAVTRGKKLVVIVGTKKAMAIAVKNNKTEKRYTYLRYRLGEPRLLSTMFQLTMSRAAIGRRNRYGYQVARGTGLTSIKYYDKSRDVWVLGHWEERPGGPGYWSQQQVWVVQ